MSSIGFDCGNGFIKGVLVEDGEIKYHVYSRNLGVVPTIQDCLFKLGKGKEFNSVGEIKSVGITGAGRRLATKLIGADSVKTEIIAQAIGVMKLVPGVKTIFDLGQEDSKILSLEDEILTDFSMNSLCLVEDTNIITEGHLPKEIKEIGIGERVLTHKGRFRKVKKIFKRNYDGKIMNIKCSNLRKLNLTLEHPILALKRKDIKCYQDHSRSGNIVICKPLEERNLKWCGNCIKGSKFYFEPKFIQAKKLEKGDLIAIPLTLNFEDVKFFDFKKIKPKNQRQILKEVDKFFFNPDLLRVLGYYLAEGNLKYCKSRGKKKKKCLVGVQFTFNIKEERYINEIIKTLKKYFDVSIKPKKIPERKLYILNIYNKSFAQIIEYLCSSKAENKKLSKELMNLKPELQLEILKGLFRGDGTFINRFIKDRVTRHYVLRTISKNLAYQTQAILLRNKIRCGFYKDNQISKGGFIVYNVGLSGKEINKLKDKLFNIKEKEFKKTSSQSFIYSNWLFIPIKEIIEKEFDGIVYNLEIEEDNSYVANSLAVHNCGSGTGSYLENVASRFGINIEDYGDIALESKNPVHINSKCAVFGISSCVSMLNKGAKMEDILMGVSNSLVRNYVGMLAKGRQLYHPYAFVGGVSNNKAIIKSLEEELNSEVIVPKYNSVSGAYGIALLAEEERKDLTKFKGFEIVDKKYDTKICVCKKCENQCELISLNDEKGLVGRIGSRCGEYNK